MLMRKLRLRQARGSAHTGLYPPELGLKAGLAAEVVL